MNIKQCMTVVPTGAALGAEIIGIDLSKEIDQETFEQIDRAFNNYGVIFFRNQTLNEEQHIQFSRRFGELEINMNSDYGLPEHPEILLISNIRENGRYIGLADAGTTWHTDMSATATPPRCSLLFAIELPRDDNGKPLGGTLFASSAAAYDALPENKKERLAGRKAVHSYVAKMENRRKLAGLTRKITQEHLDRSPPIEHPVFRTHPVTGRKCIYVTEGECTGITGIPQEEGAALISELHAHLISPEFQYLHRWQEGDFLMWDNCTCQHLAIRDYGENQRRLLHRVTVNGSVPV